jgi:hypothetical protein
MCSCSCSATSAPSCEQGSISVKAGPDSACSAAGPLGYPASGGACNAQMINPAAFAQAVPPMATGGTCAPSAMTTRPSTGATQGQVCTGEKAFGAGCTGGQEECALVPAGYQACIHHGGANMACPAGPYSTAHAVGALQDTRGCAACACSPPTATCSPGSWAFYMNSGCTGTPGLTLTANGACNATNNQATTPYQSNQFSSSPGSVDCAQPAPPSPTGTVQLGGQDTLCCE